jgi:hypothetical protein
VDAADQDGQWLQANRYAPNWPEINGANKASRPLDGLEVATQAIIVVSKLSVRNANAITCAAAGRLGAARAFPGAIGQVPELSLALI